MSVRLDARRARRETTILALLSYRRGGWTVSEIQAHTGGMTVGLWQALLRLQASGRVRSWFADGPHPRQRMYDINEEG